MRFCIGWRIFEETVRSVQNPRIEGRHTITSHVSGAISLFLYLPKECERGGLQMFLLVTNLHSLWV